MIREVHIFDVDGTIVSSLHRYRVADTSLPHSERKIDLAHWRRNEKTAMNDKLLPLAKLYQELLQRDDVYVIIATARELGGPDWQFFTEVLGLPNKVISRKRGDNRSGIALKSGPLRSLKTLKQFKQAAWHFWEDNMDYLTGVCDKVGCIPHFVPSAQGY